MGCKIDQYSESIYSLCMVCMRCKVERSYKVNRVSSSAVNVIPCNKHQCIHEIFEKQDYIPYMSDCSSFLENGEKVKYYQKK